MKRIAWVMGWATPETWFAPMAQAAIPDWEHRFYPAKPETMVRLLADGAWDMIGGYSLGAHLVLAARPDAPAVLLAPIFAFSSEAGLGGKTARAQVRYLARWLRRDPCGALVDFYRRTGLDIPVQSDFEETQLARLLWGLGQLENSAVPAVLPAGWSAWCGTDDPLLDSKIMAECVDGLHVVEGAGHHPAGLLRAWAETVR